MSDTTEAAGASRARSRRILRIAAISVAVVAIVAIALVAASGAGLLAFPARNTEEAVEAPVSPPQVVELVASTDRIVPGMIVQLACTVNHSEMHTLVYQWTASDGLIVGTGSDIEWTAPDAEGLHRIYVRVTDSYGGADDRSLSLSVRKNTPPVIHTLYAEIDDSPGWVIPGSVVEVSCEAVDQEGDDLVYAWTATAGAVTGQGSSVTWIAPDQTGLHWIAVDVTDEYGGSARRAIPVSVSRGEPPEIIGLEVKALDTHQFEPYGDGFLILGEKSCSIEVFVEDGESRYTYEWSTDRGTLTGDGPRAVFQAPPTGTSIIVVRVINEMGSEAIDSVSIGTWSFSCCG